MPFKFRRISEKKKKLHARDRRKRGRGAESKVPMFGVLKRNGRVYTQIIKNASKQELLPIVRQLVRKKSTIYTDKWKSYDGLVFDGYKTPKNQPLETILESQGHARERHRELLELRQKTPCQIQRRFAKDIPAQSQRNRIQIQPQGCHTEGTEADYSRFASLV